MLLCACSGAESPIETHVRGGEPERGRAAIERFACTECHAVPGLEPEGNVGPPLDDYGARAWIAGVLPMTPENLVTYLLNPQLVAPGSAMPAMAISEAEARDIAAYLLREGGLQDAGPPHLVSPKVLEGLKPEGH
jgi:cytochrome c2